MSPTDIADSLARLAREDPGRFLSADADYAKRRQERGLLFEHKLDPVSLMPLPLSADDHATVRAAAAGILDVLETAAELYRNETGVRDFFPAYRDAEHLLLADPGTRPTAGIFRLDGVLTDAGDFKMIEASTGGPGGVIKVGAELQLWAETVGPMLGTERPSFGDQPFGRDHLMFLRALIDAHNTQFGVPPVGAAVVGLDAEFANEVALMVGGFAELGIPSKELDATELTRRTDGGPGMLAGDFEVSLTFNKLDQVKLIRHPQARPYLEAMAHGEICMFPNLLAHCVLDDKSLMALLTDPVFAAHFTAEQQLIIAEHMPWTRVVGAGKSTDPDGAVVDLDDFVLSQRSRLVIKPNDRTRGEGVTIGSESDPATWSRRVAAAMDGGHVVQEYVALPEVEVPVADGGDVEFRSLKHGLDAFIFGGEFAGYMCRASVDTIINVGKRGVMMPVAIEDTP